MNLPSNNPVSSPSHYTSHPSGVECISITEHMSFNLGNAVKYIWRAGLKSIGRGGAPARDAAKVQDLQKALWYIERELTRIAPKGESDATPR